MIWGQVRRVVVDSAGVVINMGRRQRLFRGNARQAVLLQSSRCVVAGCATPIRRCQADHLTEWGRHGHTDGPNGAPVCGRHNRLKNSGYRVHRDDEGFWHTYRPDGTEIELNVSVLAGRVAGIVWQARELLPQRIDLIAEGGEVAGVLDDVGGDRETFVAGDLAGDARPRVVLAHAA